MPLILAPSYDDHTREEIEAHLEQVRTRRIAAALAYQHGKMVRLEGQQESLDMRLGKHYASLGRYIDQLDKAMDKVERQLAVCQTLHNESGFVADRIELARR